MVYVTEIPVSHYHKPVLTVLRTERKLILTAVGYAHLVYSLSLCIFYDN